MDPMPEVRRKCLRDKCVYGCSERIRANGSGRFIGGYNVGDMKLKALCKLNSGVCGYMSEKCTDKIKVKMEVAIDTHRSNVHEENKLVTW